MIDWERTRETVARLGRTAPGRSDGEVLAERKAKLAGAATPAARGTEELELVGFALSGEKFAIEASVVLEVCRVGTLTPLPHAPSFVRGLTNRLGGILPVLDLAPLLGLAPVPAGANARCLVLGLDRRPDFGMLVSDVIGVTFVPESDLLPRPEGGSPGLAREVVRGVTSEALIVLHGGRILRDRRLVVEAEP